VESSSNLGIVQAMDGEVTIHNLVRSSVDSATEEICRNHLSLFRLAGATGRIDGEYPGWRPNPASPILEITRRAYQACFAREARIGAIHAGLECGILAGTYPGLDMISFGPTIRFPHSPDERVHIPSVARFWTLLTAVLAEVPPA
jgi:dipeptidase D